MSRARQGTNIRLLVLFLSCGAIGWLLMIYRASPAVWLLTEVIILYLAWAGTDAIALSIVGALSLLWSATLFHRDAAFLAGVGLPLTPAQNWATELMLNWLLAMTLICKIAFAHQLLRTNGWHRRRTFYLLAMVTSVGLSLVQLMRVLLSLPL